MAHSVQPDFRPARAQQCFCGSSQLFRDCCGSFEEDRKVPFGIHLLRGHLDAASCQRWVSYLEQQPRLRLMVVDTQNSTADRLVKMADSRRVTEEVERGQLLPQLRALVQRIYSTVVRKAYNRRIAWYETPMVLRYEAGGQYQVHADSDYYNPATDQWLKCMDRDVSLLIYLNQDFTGGSLRFINFNYEHAPRTGDLIFFPSDHRYMHEAQKVLSGIRYVITSWAAFRNIERVMDQPPSNHIKMPIL